MAFLTPIDFPSAMLSGFSVYQTTLGAPLTFIPAVGTKELDDMIDAYLPGLASAQEKRANISVDFFRHIQLTGQTFKFYAVDPTLLASHLTLMPSPTMESLSSVNTSPLTSDWDWSQISGVPAPSQSSQSSHRSNLGRHSSRSSSRRQCDFSSMPGMKIMTKDGIDVTNSASRGSKTKEQRDHAHLMRVLGSCDSCRRRKVRCDPSHKKRCAFQASTQPLGVSKPITKSKTAPLRQEQRVAARGFSHAEHSLKPVVLDSDALTFDASIDDIDSTSADYSPELWEQWIQFPGIDEASNLGILTAPDSYLNSTFGSFCSSSSASYAVSSSRSATPPSHFTTPQDVSGALQDAAGFKEASDAQLPLLSNDLSESSYRDFNLYSPESTFSEDERMISLAPSLRDLANERNHTCLTDERIDFDRSLAQQQGEDLGRLLHLDSKSDLAEAAGANGMSSTIQISDGHQRQAVLQGFAQHSTSPIIGPSLAPLCQSTFGHYAAETPSPRGTCSPQVETVRVPRRPAGESGLTLEEIGIGSPLLRQQDPATLAIGFVRYNHYRKYAEPIIRAWKVPNCYTCEPVTTDLVTERTHQLQKYQSLHASQILQEASSNMRHSDESCERSGLTESEAPRNSYWDLLNSTACLGAYLLAMFACVYTSDRSADDAEKSLVYVSIMIAMLYTNFDRRSRLRSSEACKKSTSNLKWLFAQFGGGLPLVTRDCQGMNGRKTFTVA